MEEHELEPRDPRTLDPTIGITIVVLIIGVVAFAAFRVATAPEITEDDIAFEPLRVDTDRLLEERRERSRDVDPDREKESLAQLREVAREANEMSFGSPSQLERRTTAKKLSILADQVIPAYGYDGFIYSAKPLFIECGKGLEELLEAIRRGQLTVEDAQNPPADTFERYRRNCGNVLPLLVEQGLVTSEGEWTTESGPAIFDVLNRYRWAHLIDDRRRAITQLTPYEREILMRWRIEEAEAFEPSERWEYLNRAKGLDGYDVNWAAGVLSYRDGNLEQALDYFQKAADNKENERADDIVEYLEKRLESPDTS
jgi:hypothetical protein